jgi:hypothetical protein
VTEKFTKLAPSEVRAPVAQVAERLATAPRVPSDLPLAGLEHARAVGREDQRAGGRREAPGAIAVIESFKISN